MSVFRSRFKELQRRVPIDEHNCAVQFDETKCKNCTLCRRACANTQSIMDYYSLASTGDMPICVHCGQCASACPFDAITEVNDVEKVKAAIQNPDKIVIFQTAPAVRVGLGESFGMEPGTFVEGKMVAALRALGGDYVFDTDFGADLTIMEEATELLHRLQSEEIPIPQFTSCCPAWVEFAEIFYPDLLPHLSSTKSPISILSPVIKTFFAQKKDIDPSKIVNVCVTPCTAKKAEILRPEFNSSSIFWDVPEMRDTDICITTRELANWIKEENIDFAALEDSKFDTAFGESSGGGKIFGNSGGVMEAAIRTAYHLFTGRPAPKDFIPFEEVRGQEGVKKASVAFGHFVLHVASISGLANARAFIDDLIKNNDFENYSFIEVMACPGGCIGGGGQPKVKLPQVKKVNEARIASLYKSDEETDIKASWQNPEIEELYKLFLDEPLSEMAEWALHTYFSDKSDQLGKMKNLTPETNPMSTRFKPTVNQPL
ncbi:MULTISPECIES: [FeFe] hydrogenase, group A [Megasphaera]|jgi:iron-only hydrogenase group A|uniref:[FeFe] hydrogenase, group A n=1 Tax=Megasphaera TaxID=906 RepID=UPI00143A861B|nr:MULTISPECIES: [FeFe] hydrogenase, group A [Megasphaera]NJE35576.1 hydrogenase [Megasphaera sp. SW808]